MATVRGVKAGQAYILIRAVDQTGQVLQGVERRLRRVSENLMRLGAQIGFFGAAAAFPIGKSISEAVSYTDALTELIAVAKLGQDETQILDNLIRHLGRTTSFTAREVASAAVALARGRFSYEQIAHSLETVLNLARSGKIDLETAANTIVRVATTFNIPANKAAQIADKLFEASRQGTATLPQLAESLTFVGQTAAQMGLSLDETLASLAVMSNQMLFASKAGTSLNNMLVFTVKNNEKLKELFGVDVSDSQGGFGNYTENLFKLNAALSKLPKMERLKVLQEVFNIRGARAAVVLDALDRYEATLKAIQGSAGEAAKAAKLMDSRIGGTIRRILSALNDFMIRFGEAFEEPLKRAEQVIIPFLNGLSDWIAKNKEVALTIGKIFLVLIGFMGITFALALVVKAVGLALVPFIAGFRLVSGIFMFLIQSGTFIVRVFGAINLAINSLIGVVTRIVTSILGLGFSLIKFLLGGFGILGKGIGRILLFLGKGFGRFVIYVFSLFQSFFSLVGLWIMRILATIGTAVSASVLSVVQAISSVFGVIGAIIGPILAPLMTILVIGGLVVTVLMLIWELFKAGGLVVQDFVSTAYNAIANFASAVWEFLVGLWQGAVGVFKGIVSFGRDVISSIVDYWKDMGNFAIRALSKIKDYILAGDIEGAMQLVMKLLKFAWSEAVANLKMTWIRFTTFIQNVWYSVIFVLREAWDKMVIFMSRMLLKIVDNQFGRWLLEKMGMAGFVDAFREEIDAEEKRRDRERARRLKDLNDKMQANLERAQKKIDEIEGGRKKIRKEIEDELKKKPKKLGGVDLPDLPDIPMPDFSGFGAGSGQGRSMIPTKLPEALEKGTLAAFKKSFENRLVAASMQTAEATQGMFNLMRNGDKEVVGVS